MRGSRDPEVRHLEKELRDAYTQLRLAEDRIDDLSDTLVSLEHSGSYRLARLISVTARSGAPPGTSRRRALLTALALATEARADPRLLLSTGPRLGLGDVRWNRFCRRHDPSPAILEQMRELSRSWEHRPLESIVMPTYDPRRRFLRAAIGSVQSQAYERWELCIVGDGWRTDTAGRTVARYRDDPRIRFSERLVNGGIAEASQTAADMSTGELVALLDHDDVLRQHPVFEMVNYLRAHPACDLVYSDEDRLDPWGRRVFAHLKPDWPPELMESCNTCAISPCSSAAATWSFRGAGPSISRGSSISGSQPRVRSTTFCCSTTTW